MISALRIALVVALGILAAPGLAQERPYFVTYDHHMEEPGNLEVATNPVIGQARGINTFIGNWTEFEYGAKGWWTSEFYIDSQHTMHDNALLTGFRFENRFRLLLREHRVNPVLYVEYEHVNGADKTLKEVVGFDGKEDHSEPNREARLEHERELETKLILSSQIKGWNVSENLIGVKNIHEGVWEFGYAFGISRPLALAASANACTFCRENFTAGVELYGGLGEWGDLTFKGTSQYVAPVLALNLPGGTTLRVSPGFGLTDQSHSTLVRFGVSHEFSGFGQQVRKVLREIDDAKTCDSNHSGNHPVHYGRLCEGRGRAANRESIPEQRIGPRGRTEALCEALRRVSWSNSRGKRTRAVSSRVCAFCRSAHAAYNH